MECYQALPRKVSNSILILIHNNWIAFFKANEAYKEKGRNILLYDKQALGKRAFKKTGKLIPSGLPIEIGTKVPWDAIDQVRIIPRLDGYRVEVVPQKAEKQAA